MVRILLHGAFRWTSENENRVSRGFHDFRVPSPSCRSHLHQPPCLHFDTISASNNCRKKLTYLRLGGVYVLVLCNLGRCTLVYYTLVYGGMQEGAGTGIKFEKYAGGWKQTGNCGCGKKGWRERDAGGRFFAVAYNQLFHL